jgi:hypothetical protein
MAATVAAGGACSTAAECKSKSRLTKSLTLFSFFSRLILLQPTFRLNRWSRSRKCDPKVLLGPSHQKGRANSWNHLHSRRCPKLPILYRLDLLSQYLEHRRLRRRRRRSFHPRRLRCCCCHRPLRHVLSAVKQLNNFND